MTPQVQVLPPGAARGAESSTPKSKAGTQRNNYGRLQRTERRGNAQPGDVLTKMAHLLFPEEAA